MREGEAQHRNRVNLELVFSTFVTSKILDK